jgi:hypothetical protein
MPAQPRSRVDIAQRLADRLGTELSSELLEIVPPVAWDEIATRSELRAEVRHQHERVDQRLRAVRDALAVAQHDEVRRLIRWNVATLVALAGLAALGRARR